MHLSRYAGFPVTRIDSDDLKVGEIANTGASLDVGVPTFAGAQTTWLATGLDLDQIPITFPIPPERLIDTRIKTGRTNITKAAANAFDSASGSRRIPGSTWDSSRRISSASTRSL